MCIPGVLALVPSSGSFCEVQIIHHLCGVSYQDSQSLPMQRQQAWLILQENCLLYLCMVKVRWVPLEHSGGGLKNSSPRWSDSEWEDAPLPWLFQAQKWPSILDSCFCRGILPVHLLWPFNRKVWAKPGTFIIPTFLLWQWSRPGGLMWSCVQTSLV